MKILKIKLGLLSLLAVLAVSVFLTSCEQSIIDTKTDIIHQQISEIPILDDTNLSTEEEYPSKLIATIQKDGHQIKFHSTGSPEDPGIFMEESLYGTALQNQEEYHLAKDEEGANPFDVFAALTDTDVSVPKAIANSAKDDLLELSGRKIMESSNSLELLDATYSEEDAEVTFRGCSGDIGYSNFQNWYCGTSYWWSIQHCQAWESTSTRNYYSIFDGTWQKHQNTRVRINNTCESVTLFFSTWSGSNWALHSGITVSPGNHYRTQWFSSKKYLRLNIVPHNGAKYRTLVNFVK